MNRASRWGSRGVNKNRAMPYIHENAVVKPGSGSTKAKKEVFFLPC